MSIIFIEKNYDHFEILLKALSLLLLLLIFFLFVFNLYLNNQLKKENYKLDLLKEEKIKYQSLIKNNKRKDDQKINRYKHLNLLIKFTQFADNVIYESIYVKNNKLHLSAMSKDHKSIFTLIAKIKANNKFSSVKLLKINKKDNYYFQIETRLKNTKE